MLVPAELAEAFRRREAVLVAGTGCVRLCGGPGWGELIPALVDRLPREERQRARALGDAGRSEAALALAVRRLGAAERAAALAEVSAGPRPVHPALLALAAAPWRGVISTALDPTWQRAHHQAGSEAVVLSAGAPLDDELVTDEARLLVHVLGQLSVPETLCLGPGDLRTRVVDTGLGDLLIDLARRCAFVFVGFEPQDPDLAWIAGRLLGAAGGEQTHFVLCPDGSEGALLGAAHGLEALTSEGPLPEALGALATAATALGGESSAYGRRVTSYVGMRVETRWRRAARTLERLAELEGDPDARAMYLYAAALIHRDRMDDAGAATRLLDEALELDPGLGPAWEALQDLAPDPEADRALIPLAEERVSELTDDERMLWTTRGFSGGRRGQA